VVHFVHLRPHAAVKLAMRHLRNCDVKFTLPERQHTEDYKARVATSRVSGRTDARQRAVVFDLRARE
jgi:hypothetical protein